jgi:AcrR family transcriptional regulator
MSLRERKKERTREELMRAAIRLADERGVDAFTVQDVAAAADVSPRTFFRYFPTKLDALFGDDERRVAQIRASLAQSAEGESILDAVRRAVLEFVGEFAAERDVFLTRARIAFGHPALAAHAAMRFARFEREIAHAVARDLGLDEHEDLVPRLTGALVAAAIRSTSQTWVARGGRGDPRELVNASFDAVERGLAEILPEPR